MSRTARKLAQAQAEVAALREMLPAQRESLDIQTNEIVRLRKALVLQGEMWALLAREADGQRIVMPNPFESASEGVRRHVKEAAELGVYHAKAALEGKL